MDELGRTGEVARTAPTSSDPQLVAPYQARKLSTISYANQLEASPTLPSQILGSYNNTSPPNHLLAETFPVASDYATRSIQQSPYQGDQSQGSSTSLSYAHIANDLINQDLGRSPSGGSVVEPDSVIGESGRLYHGYKEGKYFLPNDAAEQDRLDLQHEVARLLYHGWLAMVPFQKAPKYVLDIGTGTGIWASEFAEQNPDSYVIGADLSAIQPIPSQPNCTFIKADIEDDWVFPESDADHSHCGLDQLCEHNITFDYIHLRYMYTCFNDIRTVIQHAYDNLNPGGWIEFQEARIKCYQANPSFTGNALQRWSDGCIRGAKASGRDIDKVPHYKGWLEEIGFVGVVERQLLSPFGPWHADPHLKRVGEYNFQNAIEGARPVGWVMLKNSGMTTEEVESLINETILELRNPDCHSYCINYLIYAQKPIVPQP